MANWMTRTASGTGARPSALPTLQPTATVTANFASDISKARPSPAGCSRASATPRVISMSGMASWPRRLSVLVRNRGVSQPCHRNSPPSSVAQTRGSLSALIGEPPPATTQTPKVKDQIAMTANTITA